MDSVDLLGIIFGIGAAFIVAFTIWYNFFNKKKKKKGCGCGCDSCCGGCHHCDSQDEHKDPSINEESKK